MAKQKRNNIKKKTENNNCLNFESKYKSMKNIMNSLEKISTNCELYLNQFKHIFLNESQLIQYKDVCNKFKAQLATDSDQMIVNKKPKNNVKKPEISSVEEEYESDFCEKVSVVSEQSYDKINDDLEVNKGVESDGQSVNDLEEKVVVFFEKDDKTGRNEKRYRCGFDDCAVSSHSRANIVAHLVKHTNERDYVCRWPKCEKNFGYKKSLIGHIESFHLRKERIKCCCSGCERVFLTKSLLQKHMFDKHSNDLNHNCVWITCHQNIQTVVCFWPKCEKSFTNQKLLDTHMEEIHLKNKITFKTNEELNQNSNNEEVFKCDKFYCNFETTDENCLIDHKIRHKSSFFTLNRNIKLKPKVKSEENNTNKYTGKSLSRKRREKKYTCAWPACDLLFESPNAVTKHMRKHTGERPFKCDWDNCEKTFRYTGALKLHKEMVHLKLKQFKCKFENCSEAFISQKQLQVHKVKHTGVKKYQCDWPGCDWSTNHSQAVAKHRMRTHEGLKLKKYKPKHPSNPNSDYDFNGELKKFQCDWPGCERRFRMESNLEQHLRSHQKTNNDSIEKQKPKTERRVKAPKVPKVSQRRWDQIREKTFICQWTGCPSKYTTKSMLDQHMNTHTGQKPYTCDRCNKSFFYVNSLRKHIQNYHQSPEETDNKRFKCTHFGCTRALDSLKSLNIHVTKAHQKTNKNEDNSEISTEYGSPVHSNELPVHLNELPVHPNELPVHSNDYHLNQSNIIRLNRIKEFNSLRIQTQNQINFDMNSRQKQNQMNFDINSRQKQNQMNFDSNSRQKQNQNLRHSSLMTAKKLLTNALKKQNISQNINNPNDSEFVTQALPIPCTQPGCWRRLKTEKALEWHIKKFHTN